MSTKSISLNKPMIYFAFADAWFLATFEKCELQTYIHKYSNQVPYVFDSCVPRHSYKFIRQEDEDPTMTVFYCWPCKSVCMQFQGIEV